jgi:signal transduction histidine kinase
MRNWAKGNTTRSDALAAVTLFVILFLGPWFTFTADGVRSPGILLGGALSYLPMAWIRRFTIPVALLVAAATVVVSAMGHINQVGLLWALFVVGWKLQGRRLYVTAGAMVLITTVALTVEASQTDIPLAMIFAASFVLFVIPVLLGQMLFNANERTAATKRELALRLELQQQTVERAASDERAQLAREMHDAVAHSMSVVVLHAAGAQRAFDRSPAIARESMRTVEHTARESLVELRRLVTALRVGSHDVAGLSPPPGVDEIGALIAAHPMASLRIVGESQLQSPLIDTSVYRIVQESLTNARRHAPGVNVEVLIEHANDAVIVSAKNALTGPTPTREQGFGLVGMGERVSAVGGRFRSGINPRGEWEVWAELPIGADS